MPRHLLTSTPPNPDPRQGGPAGDDVNGADTAAAPKQHPKGPVRGRGALLALFAVLLVAWVGISGVGVSGLFTGLSQVPEMLQTADVALASVREAKFAFVDRMRPVEWAAARMNSRFDRRLVEVFLAPIMNGPEAQKTLRTYVECGGSIAGVAARLQVHENTVRYRIGQVEKMLGSRLTDPRTAAEIVLALQCLNTAKQG